MIMIGYFNCSPWDSSCGHKMTYIIALNVGSLQRISKVPGHGALARTSRPNDVPAGGHIAGICLLMLLMICSRGG